MARICNEISVRARDAYLNRLVLQGYQPDFIVEHAVAHFPDATLYGKTYQSDVAALPGLDEAQCLRIAQGDANILLLDMAAKEGLCSAVGKMHPFVNHKQNRQFDQGEIF